MSSSKDVEDVTWNIESLLEGSTVEVFLERAEALVEELESYRERVATLDSEGMLGLMNKQADLHEVVGRLGSYAGLRFSEDTSDPERGALMAKVQERTAPLASRLVFLDLEWAALEDSHVEDLLGDERLAFCAHHLRNVRRYRPHLLSEPEERVLAETSVAGGSAWVRLFSELTSAITVPLRTDIAVEAGLAGVAGVADPDLSDASGNTGMTFDRGDQATTTVGLEQGLALLQHPKREVRSAAAEAVTAGLAPGLRTRAFIFNTLLLDKSVDDRLRAYPNWLSSRNLSNEVQDDSVSALIEAVVSRYELPQRWYALKAKVLGLDRLADFDRMASVASDEKLVEWNDATRIVLDAYGSFSPAMAEIASRFVDESWIDAPTRPGKQPGAFCAYTVPTHHPYVLLNWTGRTRDVATLAHELGHGLHAWLAREQGIFHQSTPLTLAETASVFGETITSNALLAELEDPGDRFSLLASTLEDSIATVFRQVAMNRFEDAVHTERRDQGELSVDRFGELWAQSQGEMLGDSVEITDGYRTWWSYIPHFMGTPGYVYAYAYGQLLALSVYAKYEEHGADFVPDYLRLLSAGGSMAPSDLGRIVGCDLEDPSFWDAGLDIVATQLDKAVDAARGAGRLPES